MFLSLVFTLVSNEVLGNAGYIISFLLLVVFIFLNVVFDTVGSAVISASPVPFHSMASHKERGAKQALALLTNAEKVSSFCNDVVGDISGIVSGSTAAIIAAKLVTDFSVENVVMQLIISTLVAGLTIGGKAIGKIIAINYSTSIVLLAGRLIAVFPNKNR
jgi:CBS domain containing-hemolysin-like protein